ncbi:MAG: FAD-binding oxidoreductase [Gammaproteobacteria bacterium]|nr:FAD-binding oxidoreductase [Gammaproteobacteria bacterium]
MEQQSNWLRLLNTHLQGLEISNDEAVLESHGSDWTRFRKPAATAVVFPHSVEQVIRLVGLAREYRIPLVPSGGRTGLSGGAVADAGEVVVSSDRMRRIIDFNAVDRTVTVEPGVVTQAVQEFALQKDLYYPVSFASQGSSQIGGNIATNAGGIRVLRYGLTRDWVAGLKIVDGHGELLECNTGLVKNASGYDLRHLFIGSEGTLGLIVEATLRLTDPPPPSLVMLLAVTGLEAMMDVFRQFNDTVTLTAFEFLSDTAMQYVREANELSAPMDDGSPYFALLEFECDTQPVEDIGMQCFERCLETGAVSDGVISQSETQAADLWRYREGISEAITPFTPYKNDLSVRISQVPDYLEGLDQMVKTRYPDFEVLWYGHIGDGNLHMNILKPESMTVEEFEDICGQVNPEIFALTRDYKGSISAEHGIGLLKQPYLSFSRSEAELARMRGIKGVFDPLNIMNPGKLLKL